MLTNLIRLHYGLAVLFLLCPVGQGCDGEVIGQDKLDGSSGDGKGGDLVQDAGKPVCTGGLDKDQDGYGIGCPAGKDCDDSDPLTYPGAKEICDGKDNDCDNLTDEGVLNLCGTCDPGCKQYGSSPFPVDKTKDPNVKDSTGVGLDANGDLVLDKTNKNFNYMWIANTFDTLGASSGCMYASDSGYNSSLNPYCRGTISKIDTVNLKEVARYFSLTCKSKSGSTSCVDLNGKAISKDFPHAPSRTAVDYNFDVWVANRAFNGQASASKIANDPSDCIDRDKDGIIETSKDQNVDGKITVDCNGDGKPDDGSETCTGTMAGYKPEFYGDNDECILFTVNYGDSNDMGRSVCLDVGAATGASNAWVGTYYHNTNENRYFCINGTTGALSGPYPLTKGHYVYGCVVDSQRIL